MFCRQKYIISQIELYFLNKSLYCQENRQTKVMIDLFLNIFKTNHYQLFYTNYYSSNLMPLREMKVTSPENPISAKRLTACKISLTFCIVLIANAILNASVIKVQSPGSDQDIQPAIQSAVNKAVKGDIIELPAGQFIANKSVVINKFISIKGQGLGKTILYRAETVLDATLSQSSDWRGIFRFEINSNSSSGIVVSGITFKSKKASMLDGDGLSRASDIGIEMVKCVDFVITGCRFENFGNGAVSIIHDDSIVGGLICKNEFVHNVKGYDGLGLGYGVVVYGANKKWLSNPRFGSSNFIFIENNLFDYHRHSVAGGGNALYVFRYNDVRNNTAGNTNHAIDAHEARLQSGGNYYSSRAIEVYNNKIVNTTFKDGTTNCPNGTPITAGKSVDWLTEAAICTRGGEAIIHDNYIEGYRFGVGLVANNVLTNPYPIPYQQGYLSAVKFGANHTGVDNEKGSGDVFLWNDNYKIYSTKSTQNVYFWNYSKDYLKAERDYHLSAKPNYTPFTYPHPLSTITTSTDEINNLVNKDQFIIYPNPASGTINILSDKRIEAGTTMEMMNVSGAIIKKEVLVSELTAIDLHDLSQGIYFVKISSGTFSHVSKISIVD